MILRYVLLLCFMSSLLRAQDSPKLLIHIPIRTPPAQFFSTLDAYYNNLSSQVPYHFLVVGDSNDAAVNCAETRKQFEHYPHLTLLFCDDKSTAAKYNYKINEFIDSFDLLLIASDALEPAVKHYDKVLVDAMQTHFADYDGVLNFRTAGNASVNIAPVIGKKYYHRFGYVYHPAYNHVLYEREFSSVSRILGKEIIINCALLQPCNTHELHPSSPQDEEIFRTRRSKNFDLSDKLLRNYFKKEWSILICTLDERSEQFSRLYDKLSQQICDNHLEDRIEVLSFKDNRERSVGAKRNALMRQSQGMYVNFLDDDDDIHEQYIKMIHDALTGILTPDCVSLVGTITFNGENPATFIHSIQYNSYFQSDGIYYRPPNHLNTMKRSVAAQFLFPDTSYGEDTDWAMQVAQAGLLREESTITTPYYFYRYVDKKEN